MTLGALETMTLKSSDFKNQSGVEVSLEVFPKIESRSQFQYISKNGVRSLPIASSPPIDVTQLAQYSTGNPQLTFEISENSANTSSKRSQPASFIQIPYCSPNCAGVYPMLAVFVKNSQVIHTALTKVVIEPSAKVAQPLNVALVAQAPFTGNSKSDLKSLSLLTSAMTANPLAKVTLDIPGIVLQEALSSSSPTIKSTVSNLATWAQQSNHQIITSGYVPIDLPKLISTGLSGLVSQELSAGKTQLEQLLHKSISSSGPFAISGGMNSTSASLLRSDGVSQILLGDKHFLPFNEKYSLSQPFLVPTYQNSSLTVLSEDSELKSDIGYGSVPYSAANQISSDLAQIYFDQPNDVNPRIVSTLFQVKTSQEAANLNAILANLTESPIVQTADLKTSFSLIPRGNLRDGKLVPPTPSRPINVGEFHKISSNISALDSSLGKSTLLSQAQGSLLASIASSISANTGQDILKSAQNTIAEISSKLSLASNKAFTVTSRKVTLPIAISSQLKVPFKGVLVINSDRLSFPHGNTIPVLISGPNTTLSIPIYAETLGIYLISAKLFTTNGQLVVAHTSIEIRSTAFSLVSIILTLGAFSILALWWVQSLRKGRRRNKRLISENQ